MAVTGSALSRVPAGTQAGGARTDLGAKPPTHPTNFSSPSRPHGVPDTSPKPTIQLWSSMSLADHPTTITSRTSSGQLLESMKRPEESYDELIQELAEGYYPSRVIAELERRVDDIRAGRVKPIPADEVSRKWWGRTPTGLYSTHVPSETGPSCPSPFADGYSRSSSPSKWYPFVPIGEF